MSFISKVAFLSDLLTSIDFFFKYVFLLDYKKQSASGNFCKTLGFGQQPNTDVHFLAADETNDSFWIGFHIKQTLDYV